MSMLYVICKSIYEFISVEQERDLKKLFMIGFISSIDYLFLLFEFDNFWVL